MFKISAIAAMAENWVIGQNNSLPWRLQEDLIRFKKITMNHSIIMGRKTFDSIGRILPGRKHWIVSRNPAYQVEGATVVPSLKEAIEHCRADNSQDEAFIIGGAEIYKQCLPWIDRLYLTVIHQKFDGDAYFPKFQFESKQVEQHLGIVSDAELAHPIFKIISQEEHKDAALPFSFLRLERSR